MLPVPLMLLVPLMLPVPLMLLIRFTLIDRDSGGSIEICEFQEFTSSLGASVDQVRSATAHMLLLLPSHAAGHMLISSSGNLWRV